MSKKKTNDSVEPVSTLSEAARELFLSSKDAAQKNGGGDRRGRCNYRGELIKSKGVESVSHAKEIIRAELDRRGVGIPIGRPLEVA
jgi:hypothetical protein